jgi:hypothetical protein
VFFIFKEIYNKHVYFEKSQIRGVVIYIYIYIYIYIKKIIVAMQPLSEEEVVMQLPRTYCGVCVVAHPTNKHGRAVTPLFRWDGDHVFVD